MGGERRGNFPSAWSEGEVLVVEFMDLSSGEAAVAKPDLKAHQEGEIIIRLQKAD